MKMPLLFIALILSSGLSAQKTTPPKVLMVVSGYGKNAGKTRPGFEMDEFAQAYLIFTANGLVPEVASPQGGKVEPDEFNPEKPYIQAILKDSVAQQLLRHTLPTARIHPQDYSVIYIVGGKGAMFDLPVDPFLQEAIVAIDAQNGIVASVCHGAAALAHVKKSDGSYWVTGKKVTGFCNAEEAMFGKKWKMEFPFLLEDKLKARAAIFEQTEIMLPHVAQDKNVITGQNPYSTTAMANAVVRALGIEVAPRPLYPDENSMLLLSAFVKGQKAEAHEVLAQHKDQYDVELIALYGYLRAKAANDNVQQIQLALEIMHLATPHYYNVQLSLAQVECYLKLNDKAAARALLQGILDKEPDQKDALKMLQELN
jgi:putative intracellular protease/amidase